MKNRIGKEFGKEKGKKKKERKIKEMAKEYGRQAQVLNANDATKKQLKLPGYVKKHNKILSRKKWIFDENSLFKKVGKVLTEIFFNVLPKHVSRFLSCTDGQNKK